MLLLAQAAAAPAQDAGQRFEVASVKPNTGSDLSIPYREPPADGMVFSNYPLDAIVRYAFDVQDVRLTGLPQWAREERFDVLGRGSRPLTEADRRVMVRTLLVERFALEAHFEPREQTVLVMTAARPDARLGSGLTRRADCDSAPCTGGGTGRPDGVTARGLTMARLAGLFSAMRRQLVYDETGLAGFYDVEMKFRRDDVAPDVSEASPSFFSAVEEQLGLKITPQRRQVDVLVVERIARPTPD